MRSYDAIEDPTPRSVLQLLSFKATHRAKYFWAGMLDIAKYNHYALNAPLYTHFTTPIRRYADIMVHRPLEFILQGSSACSSLIRLFWDLLITSQVPRRAHRDLWHYGNRLRRRRAN